MLGVEERTGLDVFEMLALDVSLDEEKPCERLDHPFNDRAHEGAGEWYLQFKCPNGCVYRPRLASVMLVCTKFKERCMQRGVVCHVCKEHFAPGVGFLVVERK